jgi:hypothetical protein
MPFAVRHVAQCTAKVGSGVWCTSPFTVHLVVRRTAKNGQCAMRLPHDAPQIDLTFLFFPIFHIQKFPKNIYMTYISQYPSQASYISQHASYMS